MFLAKYTCDIKCHTINISVLSCEQLLNIDEVVYLVLDFNWIRNRLLHKKY